MSAMVEGDPSAPIMVIGMAPGNEELLAGRPFIGGSGKLLWGQSRSAGFGRENVYIVNTINELPERTNPTAEQYEKYWDAFDEAVGAFRGRIVLCLGGAAFWRYTFIGNLPAAPIESWRGYLVSPEECDVHYRTVTVEETYKTSRKNPDGSWKYRKGDTKYARRRMALHPVVTSSVEVILPTIHPAAVLRAGFATLPAFAADIRRVGRALRGQLEKRTVSYVTYEVLEAPTSGGEPVSVDIETDGLHGDVNRVGLATRRNTMTLPWGHQAAAAARHYTENTAFTKIFWNSGFDIPRLEAAGVKTLGDFRDPMLGAQLLQPDLFKGLKKVAPLLMDVRRWDHKALENPEKYNATDANYTLVLDERINADLQRTGQYDLYTGTIIPALRPLMNMTKRGILMDPLRRIEWQTDLRKRLRLAETHWNDTVGVNPNNPAAVRKFLYQQAGLQPQYNKYGGVTTDVGALKELLSDPYTKPEHKEILSTLLELRDSQKLLKTYAETPLADDGCVHPQFLPATKDHDTTGRGLAGTWRIIARDPNMQNQPKVARKLYVPRPGHTFIEWDYEQLEARILAVLSGDAVLQAAIEEGLHDANMQHLNVDRVRAKNGFYGWMNFAGGRVLRRTFIAHDYDIEESECWALLDAFDRRYKRAAAYRQQLVGEATYNHKITNPFGLVRYFYGGDRMAPAAVSTMMQSTAAMMTWSILPELHSSALSLDAWLLLLVHDSFLLEAPDEAVPTVAWMCRQVGEREFPEIAPGFKVPISIKTGRSWGEMEPWDKT